MANAKNIRPFPILLVSEIVEIGVAEMWNRKALYGDKYLEVLSKIIAEEEKETAKCFEKTSEDLSNHVARVFEFL